MEKLKNYSKIKEDINVHLSIIKFRKFVVETDFLVPEKK
jgi:hypothetical protein